MPDETEPRGGFVNLGGTDCPKCGQRMPTFRVPTSLHQLMWGGWSCPSCGCEMDKWGKEIDAGEAGSPGAR
jgi:hypothetical protein